MPRLIPAISDTVPALSVEEACAFLGGITERTLANYTVKGIKGRRLARHRVGGRVWYTEAGLRAFVSPSEEAASPALATGKAGKDVKERLRKQGFNV